MVLTLISPLPQHQLRNLNTRIHRKKSWRVGYAVHIHDIMVGVLCTHRAFLDREGRDALLEKNKHLHDSSADFQR